MPGWLPRRRGAGAAGRRVPAGIAGADDRARRYAAELLGQAREELSRADAKVSILLATAGVSLGAVAGGLAARGWSPFRLPVTAAAVWWAGVAAVSGGITALLAAVYPRRRRRLPRCAARGRPGGIGFYRDVTGYRSAADVAAAIHRSAGHDLELIADQILQIARIVDRKYRLLACGLWLLAAGILCDVTALLISAA